MLDRAFMHALEETHEEDSAEDLAAEVRAGRAAAELPGEDEELEEEEEAAVDLVER